MSEAIVSHRVAQQQDWFLSVLMHAVVLGVAWLLMQYTSFEPDYVALDSPIAWVSTVEEDNSGAGGGGGGGAGDGRLGGGGGGGDGSELQHADGDAGAMDAALAALQARGDAVGDLVKQAANANATAAGPKTKAASPEAVSKQVRMRKADGTAMSTGEVLAAAKKREMAAQLAAEQGRTKKTGLDAADTGGIGTGSGTGIGSGSGTGIGSGSGDGIGSSKGSGTGGGTGTGLGSGSGPGIGSGEGTGVGSGVGAGTGSGFGSGRGKEKASWRQIFQSYMHSRKRYPNVARRLRQEGTVRVRASFAADGSLISAAVASSSGVASLDEAALQLVREAAQAAAAKAQPGQPTPLTVPVKYELVD